MALFSMLGWWYSRGWAWSIDRIGQEIQRIGRIFAVGILLKTWFAPWKQITTVSTFQNFFQSMIDNLISRLIGFFIRTFMLIVASLWASFILVSGMILVLLWPLIPFAIIILPILYLRGVTF